MCLNANKVTWAGPNCTTHNHLYFHSFSLVFYGLMTVSFIQLFFCIRNDTHFFQKGRMVNARARWMDLARLRSGSASIRFLKIFTARRSNRPSGGRRKADRRPPRPLLKDLWSGVRLCSRTTVLVP